MKLSHITYLYGNVNLTNVFRVVKCCRLDMRFMQEETICQGNLFQLQYQRLSMVTVRLWFVTSRSGIFVDVPYPQAPNWVYNKFQLPLLNSYFIYTQIQLFLMKTTLKYPNHNPIHESSSSQILIRQVIIQNMAAMTKYGFEGIAYACFCPYWVPSICRTPTLP